MELDRTDLAVFAVLLLAAFAAYVFYAAPFAPAPAMPTPDATAEPTMQPTPAVADALLPCLDSSQPDACAGNAAYAAKNADACQTWPRPDACRFFYFAQRAQNEAGSITTQDGLSDCLSINDSGIRAACLQEYAVRTKNPEYCMALEYGRFRQACIDEVSQG